MLGEKVWSAVHREKQVVLDTASVLLTHTSVKFGDMIVQQMFGQTAALFPVFTFQFSLLKCLQKNTLIK